MKQQYKIFVVEDNPTDVLLLRMALKEAGVPCDLIVIDDGGDALAFVQQDLPSDAVPDLAILDLNLPKRDGFEVLESMRSNAALSQVPVAILSSSPPRDRARLRDLRVQKYMVKPADLEEFLKLGVVIRDLLSSPASGGQSSTTA